MDAPEYISLNWDEYVCDIEFGSGKYIHDFVETVEDACAAFDSTKSLMLFIDEFYPLVGFHGTADSKHIKSLGLIWYDSRNPDCYEKLSNQAHLEMLESGGLSYEESYDALSNSETKNALSLEAILTFNQLSEGDEKIS